MNLLSLRTNFQTSPPEEQAILANEYFAKRAIDLEKTAIIKTKAVRKKGGTKSKEKKIPVTIEQLELLKKLNLI